MSTRRCYLNATTCARFLSAEFDQSCPARLQLFCTSDFSDVKIGMNYNNIMVMIRNRLYNKQLKDSNSAVIFNLLPVIQQNFLKKQQTVACLSNSHCIGACCRSSLALAAGNLRPKKGAPICWRAWSLEG